MKSGRVLILLAGIIYAGAMTATAQISSGGTPVSFTKSLSEAPAVHLTESVDVAALVAEDLSERAKDVPPRFGFPFDVRLDMQNSGTWETLADGSRLWRLRIESPGAFSINLLYDRFWLPDGATFFIHNEDKSHVIGAFTSRNNKDYGSFATGLVKGDVSILEYWEPADVNGEPEFRISRIVHAYHDMFNERFVKDALGFGSSGSCNNNVNCPEGDDWQDQKRSVAMVLLGSGTRWCSGAMINNVRQDLTPYFLSANHCLGGESTWIIMFNYESPNCTNINGPTWMTVSGTTLRASNAFSDFGLVELSASPPDSYDVYYAGWSAIDVAADSVVGIHHPAGDIKKISFDYDQVTSTSYLGTSSGDNSHWRIGQWEDGTTEGGSSGSPIFNREKQITGQLHGGYASCTSITSDWYGKVSRSWTYGSSVSTRLKDWLDPDNSGALTLNGKNAAGISVAHTPLSDTRDTLNDYTATALIVSDVALNPDSLLLYYEIASTGYNVVMTATGTADEFSAEISAQSPGTDVSYYLLGIDVDGKADTTDTFTFRVIDYGLSLAPAADTTTGPVDDTLWYSLRVTNTGVYADDYALSIAGNYWATAIYDAAGTTPISSTGSLVGDAYLDFSVRVIVPVSVYGDFDEVVVTAQSTGDPSFFETATLQSVSDGQPLTIPFEDEFLAVVIDAGKWVQTTGADVNVVGIDEPSEPYSLNLDGSPSGADTVMSQVINLAAESNIILRYFYQRTGGGDSPEAGDDLFVEYKNDLGAWVLLQQLLGDGPDMTAYEEILATLPANAYHSAFRLRLRSKGTSGTFDDWFIDDIYLGVPQEYVFELKPDMTGQYAVAGDSATYLMQVKNKGAQLDDYTFSDSLGAWSASYWDASGTAQITSTGYIPAGDSLSFIVKVEVPSGSAMDARDSLYVKVTSVAVPALSEQSLLVTYSAGLPGGFPWYEPFPADTLIGVRWVENVGATISSMAPNPPSAPYTLNLDGGIDTIGSQEIDLSSVSGVVLSFFYERGGAAAAPSSGEDLFVEYKDQYDVWNLVSQLPGSGPVMTAFEQVNIELPPGAYHSAFQFRLRSFGSCVGCDNWYVDNLSIDYAPAIAVSPLSFEHTVLQGDSATDALIISNNGQGALTYNLAMVPVVTKGSSLLGDLIAAGEVQPARRSHPDNLGNYSFVKGTEDPRVGLTVDKNAGGPDAFGYFWLDSDEPGGPVFDWIDASVSGADIVGDLNDDSYGGPYSLGFSFPYYGDVYSQVYVGSNGIIGFAPTDMAARFYKHIPNDTTPNAILAWLWDDLNPDDGTNPGAAVYIDTTGGRCVIQFSAYPEYQAGAGDVITAQVILRPDGSIKYQYLDVPAGFEVDNCTVGIESPDGTDGLEVAYLTPYVKSSLAIEFFQPYRWLNIEGTGGALGTGQADTLPVMFTSAELDAGLYQANIIINSNDPANAQVTVPASLTVTVEPAYLCGDVNNDGQGPNVTDLTYLVAYLFQGGPAPPIFEAADVNSSGALQVSDVTYLVAFLFQGGPGPVCGG